MAENDDTRPGGVDEDGLFSRFMERFRREQDNERRFHTPDNGNRKGSDGPSLNFGYEDFRRLVSDIVDERINARDRGRRNVRQRDEEEEERVPVNVATRPDERPPATYRGPIAKLFFGDDS